MPSKRQQRKKTPSKTSSRAQGRDATALLMQDHKTVKALLKKLENADDRGRRGTLLKQIENELKIHTQIEEEIFYPAYKNAVKSAEQKTLYFEAMEEHHVVDLVLPEIKDEDAGSEQFAAKGKVLKDIVEHHIQEEEKQMFPKARRAMGVQQLKDLGMRLQQRKQQLSVGMWDRAMGLFGQFSGQPKNTSKRRAA